jgi:arginine exporter protein ArgO
MHQVTLLLAIGLPLAVAAFVFFKGANDWRTLILLLIAAICAYGFVAAGEPGQERYMIYPVLVGGACLLGACWLAAKR